jgi:hypothetical protein
MKVACGSGAPVGIKMRAVPIGFNPMMQPNFVNKAAMLNTLRSIVVYTLMDPLKTLPAVVELAPESFTTYNDCILAGVGGTAKRGLRTDLM